MKKPSQQEKNSKPVTGTEDEPLSEDNLDEDVIVCEFLVPLSPERIWDLFPSSRNPPVPGKKEETRLTVVLKTKKLTRVASTLSADNK